MSQKSKFPVNLPKTNFDMRAGLVNKEPLMLEKWKQQDIYNKRLKNRSDAPKFIFHDGPPYANGDIHIGTALNKILKDVICRHKYMNGFQVNFIPGWDCHGLPIELNTLKALKKNAHALTPIELRQKSREYAQNFVNKQMASFVRLGIEADWNNPYLTMSNDYEASIIEAFGTLVGNGYIYRGQRPIYWSPKTRTALADAEVEYHEHTSPTVYVLFPIANNKELGLSDNSYVLIWTTTPWTLPANVAVAFHPESSYEAVTLTDGRTIVIASALKEKILALTESQEKSSLILSKATLESFVIRHPWIDRESKVVFADYVTMDAGTGIVHTAPGHGTDDFHTGLKYGLPILSPVDDAGCFTSEVPEWEGMDIFDANPKIIEFLKNTGKLYYTTNITHSYPHDWRTKTPVIFRTKSQWFFKVSDKDLAQKALTSLPKVNWIPSWGEERLKNMLTDRPDWCVSRQRKWGVPIPAFYCDECEEVLVSKEIAFDIAKKVREQGLNFWSEHTANELLPKDCFCAGCGKKEFRKEEDILDVWFDSGTSHYAVLRQNNLFPADLYFEGNDQYRGWFQASLWNSMGLTGELPFKNVLTHGWVLDENGHQMHKSAGNSVSPNAITDVFGADILRLWTVTEDYTKDLRIGSNLIQKTVDLYRKLRNTFRYLLGTLGEFGDHDRLPYDKLTALDQSMLHRLASLKKSYEDYMNNYQFHRAYRELFNFTIVDLSGEYFDILKDRLYIFAPQDPMRLSAQTVLSYILEELILMLAPVLVFTTEEVYQHTSFVNKSESLHLCNYKQTPSEWWNDSLANDMKLLSSLREESLKKMQLLRDEGIIGSSLEGMIRIQCPDAEYDLLLKYQDTLKEVLIVSEIILEKSDHLKVLAEKAVGEKCGRCWHLVPKIQDEICSRCADALTKF